VYAFFAQYACSESVNAANVSEPEPTPAPVSADLTAHWAVGNAGQLAVLPVMAVMGLLVTCVVAQWSMRRCGREGEYPDKCGKEEPAVSRSQAPHRGGSKERGTSTLVSTNTVTPTARVSSKTSTDSPWHFPDDLDRDLEEQDQGAASAPDDHNGPDMEVDFLPLTRGGSNLPVEPVQKMFRKPEEDNGLETDMDFPTDSQGTGESSSSDVVNI
jgi:hypothetical protein